MKLVSVIMPTYNVEKYIDDAVNSILRQSYKNFEFIIVDDCSSDNTYNILLNYIKKDNRIKLYRNPQNLKIAATLNKALEECNGDFIMRMDGDDICESNRIQILLDYLNSNIDCDLVGSYINCINQYGEYISIKKFPLSDKWIKKGLKYQSCVLHIWMARKEVYDKLGGYRDIPYVEDYDFLLRGSELFKYANVDRPIYSVRAREGNTSSTNGLIQQKAKLVIRKKTYRNYSCEELKTLIFNDKAEKEKYYNAFLLLQEAINSRHNHIRMVTLLIKACIMSKYVRIHMNETLMIRCMTIIENRCRK